MSKLSRRASLAASAASLLARVPAFATALYPFNYAAIKDKVKMVKAGDEIVTGCALSTHPAIPTVMCRSSLPAPTG